MQPDDQFSSELSDVHCPFTDEARWKASDTLINSTIMAQESIGAQIAEHMSESMVTQFQQVKEDFQTKLNLHPCPGTATKNVEHLDAQMTSGERWSVPS